MSTSRTWEIKATQIPCGANYRQPEGCLQYHTGLTGVLQTFNFLETDPAAQMHISSQKYDKGSSITKVASKAIRLLTF